MKKIIIDGNVLVEDHFSGIGQYTQNIVLSLDNLLNQENFKRQYSIQLFVSFNKKDKLKKLNLKNINIKYLPISLRYYNALFHRQLLPYLDLFLGSGIYIFPKFISSRLLFSRSVPIIYDLTFEICPEYGEPKNIQYLQKNIKKTINKSYKIITISKNSQKDLIAQYSIDKQKIILAYPAADHKIFYEREQTKINQIKQKYGLKNDYIVSISNIEPRKNIVSIVKSYCRFIDRFKNKNIDLVIFGAGGWNNQEIKELINQKIKAGYSIILPKKYLTDEDKPFILSAAKILIFIPFYEGFGMPPLEALQCGTPVLVSNNSSLTEITKFQDFLVNDWLDIDQIANKIKTLIDKNNYYKDLIRTNKNIFNSFSWQESSKNILKNL